MSYTAPTLRSTSDLITASIWNTDIVNNILLLATSIETSTGRLSGELKTFREEITTVAFSATPTFNLALSNNFKLGVLTANVTAITVSGWTASKAATALIQLTQDGTGGRTVAYPAGWKWPSNVVPTMSTGANKTDIVVLYSPDGGTTIYASLFSQNA